MNLTFTTDGCLNWKCATEINRFSKNAASKKHLACFSTWKEKINRSVVDKEIELPVRIEANEKNRYLQNANSGTVSTYQVRPDRSMHLAKGLVHR